MLDLEKIKERLEPARRWGANGTMRSITLSAIRKLLDDIDALVTEVERLRRATTLACGHSIAVLRAAADGLDDEHTTYYCCECNRGIKEKPYIGGRHVDAIISDADGLQPCGHPASNDAGDYCTNYCGMCNEEAEAEVRRDDRMMTDPELGDPLPEPREEEVRC